MTIIATDVNWDSASFWSEPPSLPKGLSVERGHARLLGERSGPGGQDLFEEILLRGPSADLRLLVAYKTPLAAKDVPSLKRRLQAALDEHRRSARGEAARLPWTLAVATDAAPPTAKAACERERLGLLDQTGTVVVQEGPIYIHVEGTRKVKRRLRASPFGGKGARVLRLLLDTPGTALTAQEIAHLAQTSFAYAYAVLTRLEDEGYVTRRSPRTGFRLVRPVDLLKAWLDSGDRTAVVVEPFYAPSTKPADLERLEMRLKEATAPFAFTLQSAIPPSDVFVSGLPHGLYLNGDPEVAVEELKLRKVTPHNFLVLRPGPSDATSAYGVFREGRTQVATPQLILDLATHGGGRGREQAEHLLEQWAKQLPLLTAGADD